MRGLNSSKRIVYSAEQNKNQGLVIASGFVNYALFYDRLEEWRLLAE